MRLWHQSLITRLPRQQLLGQHRECCALRGKGWGKNHATVNYVFSHDPYKLYQYHCLVMDEMEKRTYKPNLTWRNPAYRGQQTSAYPTVTEIKITTPIYPEHDATYLKECLLNLKSKGIPLEL